MSVDTRRRIVRQRVAGALTVRFRLPAADDPAPAQNHLAGVCGWAAVLGLAGMVTALRAFIALVGHSPPWYAPTVIGVGVLGILSTIGAFASVHRRRLPWILLSFATAALLAVWLLSWLG